MQYLELHTVGGSFMRDVRIREIDRISCEYYETELGCISYCVKGKNECDSCPHYVLDWGMLIGAMSWIVIIGIFWWLI